jgi:PAS domain S-box-containing protein
LPICDASGSVVRWFGTNTDVTERREVAALEESRQRLQAALDASGTVTFRWNIQTDELDWDENLDRLFGVEPGQTARKLENFLAMVHQHNRSRVLEQCRRCASEGVDFEMEFRVIWPDGSEHCIYDKGRIFRDEAGAPAQMSGACMEITARKRL